MTEMVSNEIREKVEQYTCIWTTANDFGYAVDHIGRNLGCGSNNQSLGDQVNQAAARLLHDFISNRNTWMSPENMWPMIYPIPFIFTFFS
jgi:hypothetical protein